MRFVERLFPKGASLEHAARRDAAAGVNSGDDHVTRRLGPRPRGFDPVGDHEHGQVASALSRGTEIAEWTDDLRRNEAEKLQHPSALGLTIGIIFCFLVEVLGGILIMRALGVSESERLPFGIGLGLALIGITAVTSHRATTTEAPGAHPAKGRNLTALVLTVYSLLVVALACVRLKVGVDEGSGLEALPDAIIMVATTIGPAWLAEHFLRKRRPAVALATHARQLRRRIRAAEKDRTAAASYLRRLAQAQAGWDHEWRQMHAVFDSEHRLARAEQGLSSIPQSTHPAATNKEDPS